MLANGSADHPRAPFLHKSTLFAVDDDDNDDNDYDNDNDYDDEGVHDHDTHTPLASALTSHKPALPTSTRTEHSVRFEDTVHVIAPPLRSTYASRETGVCMWVPPSSHLPSHIFFLNLLQNLSWTLMS